LTFQDNEAMSTIEQGRTAVEQADWPRAYDAFASADGEGGLSGLDLEGYAQAAWWTGRIDEFFDLAQRSYAAHMAEGNRLRAGLVALRLSFYYGYQLVPSVASGWQNRAERLLAAEPEAAEHGYLALAHASAAKEEGHLDEALEHARRAQAIGQRYGDRELNVRGVHQEGRILIAQGNLEGGFGLMDEACAAAVGGELGPLTTAAVYCNTITACRDLGDYGRAGEWTEATMRWCERQAIQGFPGVCRVYRAEIMRLRGALTEAEEDARFATSELAAFSPDLAGAAFYELGEIRLRVGDLDGAEEAFRNAHRLGTDPQPGLALLRLARGDVSGARGTLARALADKSWDKLARARLLPAEAEIAAAGGDAEGTTAAARELTEIADAFGTPALAAAAAHARGLAALVAGDPVAAAESLRKAGALWLQVEAPFEGARARVLLGEAYVAEGDGAAAQLEFLAARDAFDRLGAGLESRRANDLLERLLPPASERRQLTFLVSDIVGSTSLVEAIGDEAWGDVIAWHDRTLRGLFAAHEGEEIDNAGDGFFVAFPDAVSAAECAAAIQRTLAEHRRTAGFAPQVRIGVHAAEATRANGSYRGRGVHEAARVGALAGAGEIVASLATAELVGDLERSEPRSVELKGLAEPVEVVTLLWR
jgi:class 3 adenylate cyclase